MLDMLQYEDIDSLYAANLECRACGLRQGCKQVVISRGNPAGRVMLVGEGPGAQEDAQGKVFVGPAGQLLDKILAAAELPPEDVYITNVVKCRPPGNRLPKAEETKRCLPWLERQIDLVAPKLIVCLGALAAQTLISPDLRITRDRGRWSRYRDIDITATFHPAALLRDAKLKRPVWEDFKVIRDYYKRFREE
ncbi:MAG: uracil-DNA glycosylase [Bacillota bacterium]|jgi:uracil-DNA glycosylase family 4